MLTQTRSTILLQKPETVHTHTYPQAQTITSDTTYGQAYSYADLRSVPRLTEQQRRDLLAHFPRERSSNVLNRAQQQFVESYLPFAKYLATQLCPTSVSHFLPDLIGAANLALVEIVKSRDLTDIEDLTSYLATCIQGALKGALLADSPIPLRWNTRMRAEAQGLDHVLHVVSLDAFWQEDDGQEEPYATPITPTDPSPAPDPIKRARAEEYLSLLPERTQTILRLRFGLGEEDEGAYSMIEIAARLGLTISAVKNAIHNGMARLRALAEGKATISRHRGRVCIFAPALSSRTLTETKEAALERAYRSLEAEGTAITGSALAKAAGVGVNLARTFLRARRGETRSETRAHEQQERLEEACQRLSAQAQPFTPVMLAREAQVGDRATSSFRSERRSTSDATV
jgi:RNA polymerase sigma factor (sigma-70 family)